MLTNVNYMYNVDDLRQDVQNFVQLHGMSVTEFARRAKVNQKSMHYFLTQNKTLNIETAFQIMNYIQYEPK